MSSKRTIKETAARNYYIRLKGGIIYDEQEHCELIIETMLDPKRATIAAFCRHAVVSDKTFYHWLEKYPIFYECFRYAIMVARYNWEQEEVDNQDNPEWSFANWEKRGNIKFALNTKAKIRLAVGEEEEPYLQYQQLMKQAARGEFTSDELKQVMECLNAGTRVYEAFKVQREIDEMKNDIKELGSFSGHNNIIPITSNEKTNTHSL